jgi:hypothetical protein
MPGICGTDHRVDGHPETLLRPVGTVVDIFSARPADNEDIQVMRRLPWMLKVAGCPGAEDQHLLHSLQTRELFGHRASEYLTRSEDDPSLGPPHAAGREGSPDRRASTVNKHHVRGSWPAHDDRETSARTRHLTLEVAAEPVGWRA